jgi:hypothetical protein
VSKTRIARVIVEELPEVRLAQPPIHARARLDTHGCRHRRRASDPAGQIHLTEAAFAQHPIDAVLQTRFGTGDHVTATEQIRCAGHGDARPADGAGGRGCRGIGAHRLSKFIAAGNLRAGKQIGAPDPSFATSSGGRRALLSESGHESRASRGHET